MFNFRKCLSYVLVITPVLTANACGQSPGSEALTASLEGEVNDVYASLLLNVKKYPNIVSQVTAAQAAPFTRPIAANGLAATGITEAIDDLQNQYGTAAAFIRSQDVNPTSLTLTEVRNAVQADQLSEVGDFGAFANSSDAERLKILASSLKVSLFVRYAAIAADKPSSSLALGNENYDPTGGDGATYVPPGTQLQSGHYYLLAYRQSDNGNNRVYTYDYGATYTSNGVANNFNCVEAANAINRATPIKTGLTNSLCTDNVGTPTAPEYQAPQAGAGASHLTTPELQQMGKSL